MKRSPPTSSAECSRPMSRSDSATMLCSFGSDSTVLLYSDTIAPSRLESSTFYPDRPSRSSLVVASRAHPRVGALDDVRAGRGRAVLVTRGKETVFGRASVSIQQRRGEKDQLIHWGRTGALTVRRRGRIFRSLLALSAYLHLHRSSRCWVGEWVASGRRRCAAWLRFRRVIAIHVRRRGLLGKGEPG